MLENGQLMTPIARFIVLIAMALLAGACGDDPRRAEEGARWLQERYLFRPFGEMGEINRIYVSDAELIRMEVQIDNQDYVDAINAQSLLVQSLIAKYACPNKASKLWEVIGEDITVRVDLKTGSEPIASAICMPEQA
jgi:hypothetical protein